ncbi:alcohol dehydrogenase catalytic domain-containing protein [Actinoplanes sp. TBRC 11911]|uniref:alcohol dehydrogenase catalytic domain-containing protein n=1 Tax=Actinoplanes sp. TBRC 11911 TaxID=2729386 RepID=UPI00145F645B|nr:alcohol dehydrogenase catalytic domain-containing protein [Actinoplanes sp. TBRC 11911]NMO51785.1 alcohol dehydrogenase catalytic domain-containing protein [Actinoplanes sp. TBRC 11911]
MKAILLHGPGDVRMEEVPDPRVEQPTDAVVRVVLSCVCGSDLHPYHRRMNPDAPPRPIGHEFLGVVEDVGADVRRFRRGDLVVAADTYCDGTCDFCRAGLHTSCRNGGYWAVKGVGGGQAEAVRVPQADGTLVKLPVPEDSPLLPSLLALADVYPTGYHGALRAGVTAGSTVTVIGDGAVGLFAVAAAKRMGAERIILMGRHKSRTDLGREFGATDVVAERGPEGIAKVRELTDGSPYVIEAVGFVEAYEQALGVVRDGGTISRIGVPQYVDGPVGMPLYRRNVTLTGGVAPVRAYMELLLPDVLSGAVPAGRVFDATVGLAGVADGYRAMDRRESLKVLIRP